MKNVGYYNGRFGLIEEMTIPMCDRGMFFGDGVYDATYCANQRIFEADEHIARFFRSCAALRMDAGETQESLKRLLEQCVARIDSMGELMVYWQCTRGTGLRSHRFPDDGRPGNLMVMVREVPLVKLTKPIRVLMEEDTRFLHCNIKTLNLIPNVLSSQRAGEAGCGEVIYHRGERVTECAHSNVHILKDGVFHTAPTDNLILPGVTRAHILRVCNRLGIANVEAPFTVSQMLEADEVIISSAGTLGVGVCRIDDRLVGGKDPARLRAIQQQMVEDFYAQTGYSLTVLDD